MRLTITTASGTEHRALKRVHLPAARKEADRAVPGNARLVIDQISYCNPPRWVPVAVREDGKWRLPTLDEEAT